MANLLPAFRVLFVMLAGLFLLVALSQGLFIPVLLVVGTISVPLFVGLHNLWRLLVGLFILYLLTALVMLDPVAPFGMAIAIVVCTNYGGLLILIIPLAWLIGWGALAVVQGMRHRKPLEVTP
jgi:hypothetical protein